MSKKYPILTEDFLKLHYIKNNKSLSELSKELDIPKATIYRAIKRLNIKKDKDKAQASRINNFEKTNLDRYGVKNPFSLDSTKEKIRETNLKKYGHECCLLNDDIRQKTKEANLKKYGIENPMKNAKIAEKVAKSLEHKYGGIGFGSHITSKKIYNKIENKYGVRHIMQSEIGAAKFKETMVSRYGVQNPSELDIVCKKRIASRVKNQTSISIDGKTVKELAEAFVVPYDYLIRRINIETSLKDLEIIASDYNNNITNIERIFADEFSVSRYNNFYDLKNFPGLRYRPDFKFEGGLAVNVDGLYWHSELKQPDRRYHFKMRREYEKQGLRIFQFREDEVLYKMPIVRSMVLNNLGKSHRIFARKTKPIILSQKEASKFLKETHIKGDIKSKHIGLKYKNQLVMILSYKIKNSICKIDRLSSKCGAVVVGGASKLFCFLKKHNEFSSVHYWVDLRYGTGNFLKKMGFIESKETLGWKWTNLRHTYNRLQCRANMDNRSLSQQEHAEELGWCKIYDAGQRLWVKEYVNI